MEGGSEVGALLGEMERGPQTQLQFSGAYYFFLKLCELELLEVIVQLQIICFKYIVFIHNFDDNLARKGGTYYEY